MSLSPTASNCNLLDPELWAQGDCWCEHRGRTEHSLRDDWGQFYDYSAEVIYSMSGNMTDKCRRGVKLEMRRRQRDWALPVRKSSVSNQNMLLSYSKQLTWRISLFQQDLMIVWIEGRQTKIFVYKKNYPLQFPNLNCLVWFYSINDKEKQQSSYLRGNNLKIIWHDHYYNLRLSTNQLISNTFSS